MPDTVGTPNLGSSPSHPRLFASCYVPPPGFPPCVTCLPSPSSPISSAQRPQCLPPLHEPQSSENKAFITFLQPLPWQAYGLKFKPCGHELHACLVPIPATAVPVTLPQSHRHPHCLPHKPQGTALLQDRHRELILRVRVRVLCATLTPRAQKPWSAMLRVTSRAAVLDALGHLPPQPFPSETQDLLCFKTSMPQQDSAGSGSADTGDQISALFFTSCETLNKSPCLSFPRRKVNSHLPSQCSYEVKKLITGWDTVPLL